MRVVDWLFFRHGAFPAVKSNRVENAPRDVIREIWLNIIHTHQFKMRQKQLSSLFSSSLIFFVTKFHVLVIMSKASSKVFSSYHRNRTVPSFREGYQSYSFVSTELGLWWQKRGFTECDLICYKKNKMEFFLYLNSNWFEGTEWQIFQWSGLLRNFHVKIHVNKQRFTNLASGWLAAQPQAKQKPWKYFLLTWNLTWISLCSCQRRKILFLITLPHTLPGELRNC